MKVLLTGCTGYIGKRLMQEMLDEGRKRLGLPAIDVPAGPAGGY